MNLLYRRSGQILDNYRIENNVTIENQSRTFNVNQKIWYQLHMSVYFIRER